MFSQSELSFASVPIVSDSLNDADRIRTDARRPFDYRAVSLTTRVSSSALGSAQCVIGDQVKTQVTAATRAEVESVNNSSDSSEATSTATAAAAGKVVVSLECSPGALPLLRADLPIHLSNLLTTIFATSLPKAFLEQLVVLPRSKAWTVYLDVLVESADAGNVIDMAVLAARSALATTLLPKTTATAYDDSTTTSSSTTTTTAASKANEEGIGGLVKAGKGGSKAVDFELVDGAQEGAPLAGTADLPVALTFFLIDQKPLIDASVLEEQAAQALMTIAMDGTGRVVAIEQLGEGEVDFMTVKSILKGAPDLLRLLMQAANERIH